MRALSLVLMTGLVVHAEMPKPEPALYKNRHQYIIMVDNKRLHVDVIRRVGTYGQVYQVYKTLRNSMLLDYDNPLIIDFNAITVVQEWNPEFRPKIDPADPEESPAYKEKYRKYVEELYSKETNK